MTLRNDETIQCVRCGRHFTWSYDEQRIYRERNLHQPKRCPQCRGIVQGEHRSSQIDHPSLPVFMQPESKSVSEPTEAPLKEKRPSWWASPANKLTVILWLLVVIAVLLILLIVLLL